ncbi:hypothetical protein BCUN_2162 [Bifidobacterium cuniculi]|uniref:Uncharacterized protein n=2 Tax=Bifidobacterium cuniculi TaxID=1688 RepID=A0A087ADJ0_9BIFI|nr:hypothetical protein BCUN_2162 [Bifidobacterium cuniculi]
MERMQWIAQSTDAKTKVRLYQSDSADVLLREWLAGPVGSVLANAVGTLGTNGSQSSGPLLVATMSPYGQYMHDIGQWRLRPDKQGMVLPSLVDSQGRIREQVRLEEYQKVPQLTPVLQNLMLQATLGLILEEVKDTRQEAERLADELVEDRLAAADAVWSQLASIEVMDEGEDKRQCLNQAWKDSINARHTLQRYLTRCRRNLLDRGNKEHARMAVDMTRCLQAIACCAQVEMATNAMRDQLGPQYVCLSELARFVTDNQLDQRDTFLLINSATPCRQRVAGLCDDLYAMCRRIVALDTAASEQDISSEHGTETGLPVSWEWAERALEPIDAQDGETQNKHCWHCRCELPSWQTGALSVCEDAQRTGRTILDFGLGVLGFGTALMLGKHLQADDDEDNEDRDVEE